MKNRLQNIDNNNPWPDIDPRGYLNPLSYLEDLYQATKQYKKSHSNRESYSYLNFAEELGFNHTNVIRLIIKGQRTLTQKSAIKICKSLKLSLKQKDHFLALVEHHNSHDSKQKAAAFMALAKGIESQIDDQNQKNLNIYFSLWYNPIIREILQQADTGLSPELIQERLIFKLNLAQIKNSLELLQRLNYATEINGLYYKVEQNIVSTGHEALGISLAQYHHQMLELAQDVMLKAPAEERDIQTLTFGIPQNLLPKLKQKVHQWIYEALAHEKLSEEENNRIYQLNIQLFPVSKTIPKAVGDKDD